MLSVVHAKYFILIVSIFFCEYTLCLQIERKDGTKEFKNSHSDGEPKLDIPWEAEIKQYDVDAEDVINKGREKRQAQINGYQHLYPQVPSAPPYNPYQPQSGYNQSGQYNGYSPQSNTQRPQQWNSNPYNPSQPGYPSPQPYNPNQGPYNHSGPNQIGGNPYRPMNGPYSSYNQTNVNPPYSSSYRPNNTYNQYTTPRSPYNPQGHIGYNNTHSMQSPYNYSGYPTKYPGAPVTTRYPLYNSSSNYPSQWSSTPYPSYPGSKPSYNNGQLHPYGNTSQWTGGARDSNYPGGQNNPSFGLNPQTGWRTNNYTSNGYQGQNGSFVYNPNNVLAPGNRPSNYNPTYPHPYNNNNNYQNQNQFPSPLNNYTGYDPRKVPPEQFSYH